MKIFGIIVVYNPNINELYRMIQSLYNQVDYILIGNNSNYDVILDLDENEKLKIFNFGNNLGIAKAQSICMKWAFDNNADYILQMDQDSIPHEDLVSNLLSCYSVLCDNGYNVGVVGVVDYDKDLKQELKLNDNFKSIGNYHVMFTDYIISSGTLISKNSYDSVGGMDDDLFIDLVDFEYCWRLSAKGFINAKCYEANIAHKVGLGRLKIGFLKLYTPSPIRQYYQYRNFILLLNRNYVPLKWKITELFKCLANLVFSPLFLGDYKLRIKYICKGIYAGIMRKKGHYE